MFRTGLKYRFETKRLNFSYVLLNTAKLAEHTDREPNKVYSGSG